MKKIIRRLRILVVTAIAGRVYKRAVTLAERRHNETGRQVFVISNPKDGRELIALTDREFLDMRGRMGVRGKDAPFKLLKTGCWYHTANQYGNDGISERHADIRRAALIKESLRGAGLI